MKYCIGYSVTQQQAFLDYLAAHRDNIYEVYFSWGDIPNGRSSQMLSDSLYPWQAQQKQQKDLAFLAEAGLCFNLLLNGNCYGADSLSRSFYEKIGDVLAYLSHTLCLQSVTTTSPIIAKFIRQNFPKLEIRASVNMEIGTIEGMTYLADYFDSYYMKREHNRSLPVLQALKGWCDAHGKGLFMLSNSGCLNHCSAHIFHDNLVAHEADIAGRDNAYLFSGICHEHLSKEGNMISQLRDTNFVRPEDMHLYEGYVTAAKLATRTNSNPLKVVKAYFEGRYTGSLPDLLEPNHSALYYPRLLENRLLPEGFGRQVMTCDKKCDSCSYCRDALAAATITLEE